MNLHRVEFVCTLPKVQGVWLELQGVRTPLSMNWQGDDWRLTVELPAGVHAYRFRLLDIYVNDPRRTTQRTVGEDVWSLLHIQEQKGPIWMERQFPRLESVLTCLGVSESQLPLLVTESIVDATRPFLLWVQLTNLYHDALIRVLLIRPDGDPAFGGEYKLEAAKAGSDFGIKFWLTFQLESLQELPGVWKLFVQADGLPAVSRQLIIRSS